MRLAEQLGATPAETLERFPRVVPSTTKPPLPAMAMLGETIVHGSNLPDLAAIFPFPQVRAASPPLGRSRPAARFPAFPDPSVHCVSTTRPRAIRLRPVAPRDVNTVSSPSQPVCLEGQLAGAELQRPRVG